MRTCAPLMPGTETKKKILKPQWKPIEVGDKTNRHAVPPKVFAVHTDEDIKLLENGFAAPPKRVPNLHDLFVGNYGP